MPGLHIDKFGGGNYSDPSNFVFINYNDLKILMEEGKLEIGRKYVLTDYLHKYFILGSNSSGIVKYLDIYTYSFGYATFGYYVEDLPVGQQVIVTALPEGYDGPVKVGDVTTVSANSQDYYFQFANGMHSIVGLFFKYYLARFTTIEEGSEVLDINGRPVLVPGGLINTDVHDGAAYMEMSAEENLPVLPEQLICTAETNFLLNPLAESLTFPGDLVEYDFYNTIIYNDNFEEIGTRPGLIKRRINKDLAIDLPIDWRNSKYRRWCLDLESRRKFLNQHLDVNATKLGFEGKWLFTAANRKVDQPEFFFIAQEIEGSLNNLDSNAQKTSFNYVVTGPEKAKDYPVIPLNAERNPFNVIELKSESFYNTVFQGFSGEDAFNTAVDVTSLSNSTFVSTCELYDSEGVFQRIHSIDSFYTIAANRMEFDNINILSKTSIENSHHSYVEGVIFGTTQKDVRIAANDQPLPVVWWLYCYFSNSTFINGAIAGVTPFFYLDNTRLVETSFFAYYSPTHPDTPNDSKYQREVFKLHNGVYSKVTMRFLNNVDRVILDNLLFPDSNGAAANGLFMYDIRPGVYNQVIKKNLNQQLYYESQDAEGNVTVNTFGSDSNNTQEVVKEKFVVLTQAEYDAMLDADKDSETFYFTI